MHKYLSVPEVEGVPTLCAPSDEARDLARLKAERQNKSATATPPKRVGSFTCALLSILRPRR